MIDQHAAIVGHDSIEIAAPPEMVWETLTDFEGWPSWNRAVKSLRLEGPVAPGTVFRWKAGTSTTSVIEQVERPRLISWRGRTMGIEALHVYRFEPSGNGTLVTTEESWDGLMARVFKLWLQKSLDEALSKDLQALKDEVERLRP